MVIELKSSLWATAGGKGAEIRPKTTLAVYQLDPSNVDALVGLAVVTLREEGEDMKSKIARASSLFQEAYEIKERSGDKEKAGAMVLNNLARPVHLAYSRSRTCFERAGIEWHRAFYMARPYEEPHHSI